MKNPEAENLWNDFLILIRRLVVHGHRNENRVLKHRLDERIIFSQFGGDYGIDGEYSTNPK